MNSNTVVSNLIWKFGERILAQSISLIVSVVLARLLMPEQFGLVALVMVFINVANAIITSGFNTSLIQKKDADDLDFSSVFWLSLVFSIVLYIVLWFLVIPLSAFFNNEMIIPIFRVLSLRLIIGAINSVQHAYVSRHLQFKKYFWSTLFGTIVSAIVGIYLAIKNYGAWALVFQYLTNTFIDTVVLFFTVDWFPKLIFSISRIRSLFAFGWKILADSLFGTLQNNLRNFVIGKVYTNADLAYYTNSQRVPSLFIYNISVSLSSVMLPVFSNVNDNDEKIHDYLKKSSKLLAYIIFPILIGIILVANDFVILVLTDKWSEMIPYLQLYSVVCLTQVLMPPRNEALKAIGRSDVFLNENLVMRIFDIVLLFIVLYRGPIVIMLSNLITSVILLTLIMFNTYKFNKYDFFEQIIDLKNTYFASAFMIVCVSILNLFSIQLLYSLLLKIAIGVLSYIIISVLLKFYEFRTCISLIMKYIKK